MNTNITTNKLETANGLYWDLHDISTELKTNYSKSLQQQYNKKEKDLYNLLKSMNVTNYIKSKSIIEIYRTTLNNLDTGKWQYSN